MALKISVVIPCYNAARFIEETIQSILSQNYRDFECIVMDGGSTDGTVEILRKYEQEIYFKSEKDRGQSDAINKGLKIAQGNIFAFINADDVYDKGCFQTVADFFERNPDVKWVYGKSRNIDQNGTEIRKLMKRFTAFLSKRYSYNRLLVIDIIPQPATFWRRELTDEIGLFDINDQLVMDYDYWLRAGAKYSPGFIPHYLAAFRVHTHSKTSQNPLRAWRYGTNVVRKYTTSRKVIMLRYFASTVIAFGYLLLNFGTLIQKKWHKTVP